MHKPWRAALLIIFLVVTAILLVGYSRNEVQRANDIKVGNSRYRRKSASRPDKIKYYGCSACHTIPGIAEANAKVGPPLDAFALRIYIAGQVANTPDNLRHWIMNPHQIEQHTAMPEMGVSDEDSKDIAAYLYTLH